MPPVSVKLAAGTLLGLACVAFWGQERSLAELGVAAAASWHAGMEVIEAAVKAAGWAAPLYFLGLYTASSVFCLPLLGFHTVAGYTYGTLRGALLVSICQTVGAGFSMLFARHFARPLVQGYLEKKWGARYRSVDRAVAKQGLKVVFLIRASPILPFSITNYLVWHHVPVIALRRRCTRTANVRPCLGYGVRLRLAALNSIWGRFCLVHGPACCQAQQCTAQSEQRYVSFMNNHRSTWVSHSAFSETNSASGGAGKGGRRRTVRRTAGRAGPSAVCRFGSMQDHV